MSLKLLSKRETGFTIIELLTVIIIIGVLAAIAVPVFASQRSRAQDSQTVSDVRNIVTAAETYLSDRTKSAADITDKSVLEYNSSPNVQWGIKGNTVTNGYCVVAFNTSGKEYNSASKLLSYDSTAGGLKSANGSCGPKDGSGNVTAGTARTDVGFTSVATPAAASLGSTSVGSSTATPSTPTYPAFEIAVANSTSGSGAFRTYTIPETGTYKIETWGAQGGGGYAGGGAKGAYATGTYSFTKDEVVRIAVGARGGSSASGGGGGGTFVFTNNYENAVPLVVAGGGGGDGSYSDSYYVYYAATPGSTTESAQTTCGNDRTGNCTNPIGSNTAGNAGRESGAGAGGGFNGGASNAYSTYRFGGGNGLSGDGIKYSYYSEDFRARGGLSGYNCGLGAGAGGFGGGGGGICGYGGGGGGYTGGNSASGYNGGGGGGSYVAPSRAGVNVSAKETNNTTKANSGDGKVSITRMS